MSTWGGEETVPFTFNEILPYDQIFKSLLSIAKDIPINIKIILSNTKFSIKNRIKHKESILKRIEKYKKLNNPFISIFEEEYTTFCSWIKKEQHVRTYMKILFNKWLHKKYNNRLLNIDDPCTLLPPVKLIKLFDPASRGFYQFEASSLKKQFDTSLQYSEWLFPKPSHPKNPLTNIPFNEGQRISITNALRKYGYTSWFIEAYRSIRWNLTNFVSDNSINLKINTITEMCKNPNGETIELLNEFITNQYEENEVNKPVIILICKWAIKYRLHDEYMKKWLNLMKDYYIIKFRNNITIDDDDTYKLNIIYVNSLELFRRIDKLNEYIEIAKNNNQIVLPENNNITEDIYSSSSESESESESEPAAQPAAQPAEEPAARIIAVVYHDIYDVNIDDYINSIINGDDL
jgi:hypothetical protein